MEKISVEFGNEVNQLMDYLTLKMQECYPDPTKTQVAVMYTALKMLADHTADFIVKMETELAKNPCQCENCVKERESKN